MVDSNHILTAANCVSFLSAKDLPKLAVYLNTVSLKTFNPGAIISKVIRFKAHEFYDKKTHVRVTNKQFIICINYHSLNMRFKDLFSIFQKANDIALLTLDTNVTTLYPQSLVEDDSSLVGKNGTILRWGSGKSGCQ